MYKTITKGNISIAKAESYGKRRGERRFILRGLWKMGTGSSSRKERAVERREREGQSS